MVAIIYSFEAVFTIACGYGLLVHFATCLPARLLAQWVTRSQLAYELRGAGFFSRKGIILFFLHFSFRVSRVRV